MSTTTYVPERETQAPHCKQALLGSHEGHSRGMIWRESGSFRARARLTKLSERKVGITVCTDLMVQAGMMAGLCMQRLILKTPLA